MSISTDKNIPKNTDNNPNNVATNAMDSGELTNLLEVAAGIISIEVINKIPIILTDIATTIVSIVVNNKLTNKGLIPSALAKSSSIVTRINDDQLNKINIKTIIPPKYIHHRSFEVTVMGFMFPLEQSEKQKKFLLGPYPLGCPFHYHVGASQVIEINSTEPIDFSFEPITITGKLKVEYNKETGTFYYLERKDS